MSRRARPKTSSPARDAIAAWARLTYGWLGRSPDYKAAFLAYLGANMRNFTILIRKMRGAGTATARSGCRLSITRSLHPPVDRNLAPGAPGGPTDIYAHVTKETDAGIYVTGAKVVATGSALTHFTFVAQLWAAPDAGPEIRAGLPGADQCARASNSSAASRTSSAPPCSAARSTIRCRAGSTRTTRSSSWTTCFVPWEDVFVYGDIEKANTFFPRSGFRAALPAARLHPARGQARFHHRAVDQGDRDRRHHRGFRGVEANIGEVITWRNAMWALVGRDGEERRARGPAASSCRTSEPAPPTTCWRPEAYVQIKHQIEKTVASSLIYLNSHARDFQTPELRKYLDLYVRGSGGVSAVERVKLMKLLWDAIGSEFGARHELYEVNYSGSHEEIRRFALLGAQASGQDERWKAFADPAWPNTTSTAGRCRTWSTRTTSARCGRRITSKGVTDRRLAAIYKFKVYAGIDASGEPSEMAWRTTLARLAQAGVIPLDEAVLSETRRTWNRPEAAAEFAKPYALAALNRGGLIERYQKAQDVARQTRRSGRWTV